jgi:protein TonB
MQMQITTRAMPEERFGGGFAGALLLHAAVAAALVGAAWFTHSRESWGDSNKNSTSIQATMVSSIPLPPKQPINPENVLATETPSPAPITVQPKTVEAPKLNAIPIPAKPQKPVKQAEKTVTPPQHPQPTPPQPNKAQTGEASGTRIAMSTSQTRIGTFSVGETDATFGSRFGYYNEQIKRVLEQNWITATLDPQAPGHRVYITFTIARDGTPSNIRIAQPSGDGTLDQSALSAVRHVDAFPPLPDAYNGSYINVMYYFDPPTRQ